MENNQYQHIPQEKFAFAQLDADIKDKKLETKARGYMGSYICIGAAAVFIFQGLENLGMCMGLLPVIGLTLPFLSYGGSSALSLFLLIGVVESVAAHRVKYYTERDDVL